MRRRHSRILALLFAFIFSNPGVWANAQTQPGVSATAANVAEAADKVRFAADARIMLLSPSAGQWMVATFGQTQPGNEFYYNNQLYHVVDSATAQAVLKVSTAKLFEADRAHDDSSRKPASDDVVQVLSKDMRPESHALLSSLQPGTVVRFQGKAYKIKECRGLLETGMVYAPSARSLQRIVITASGWKHVSDRHTVGGTMTAGKSAFNGGEDVKALIRCAEIVTPVPEANGYLSRVFDAGRPIAYDSRDREHITTYKVITTQEGKLVTAYPMWD